MKILIYGNRKCDDSYYDISTPEKREAGYLAVFDEIKEWGCYDEIESYKPSKKRVCEPCKKDLCRLCENDQCVCEKSLECRKRESANRWQNIDLLDQQKLYKAAKKGDGKAAIQLISSRRGNEYEEALEMNVIDPLEIER